MKTRKIKIRAYSLPVLKCFCKKILKIANKKNKRIFKKEKNGYYLSPKLTFWAFHLTRVFVPFREENLFFPRQCKHGFKQFAICGTFDKEELKGVKDGLIYIAESCLKILHEVEKSLKKNH